MPNRHPAWFLVVSLIVDQAIAMIAGPAKTRKTWTLLELAVAVQTGRPAFGEFVVAEPGPVIVVLEESGRAAFHRRLSALARGNDIEIPKLAGFHFAAKTASANKARRSQPAVTRAFVGRCRGCLRSDDRLRDRRSPERPVVGG